MKRTLTLLMALLMVSSTVVACGGGEAETKETQETTTSTESVVETEEVKATPNWDAVDKTSLGGITINIACSDEDIIDFEDYTSDILEDAIFDRNRLIESTLDCKIQTVNAAEEQGLLDMVTNAILSGDGSVDLATLFHEDAGNMMTNGRLLPFNYIEGLDMTQPWWDQMGMSNTQIHGYNFFGWMDFKFSHYDKMEVLFYNAALIERYQLEDPYDLYKNEQWTIDKLIELVQAATDDVDGDGVMDIDIDVYGFGGNLAEGMPMLHASGYHMIDWVEEESTFVLRMAEEGYINILEKMAQLYSGNNQKTYWAKEDNDLKDSERGQVFIQGRQLFYAGELKKFKDFRENEDDYGLIMYPRYDYSNEISTTIAWGGEPLVLPKDIGDDNKDGNDDYAELGIFLQAVGAYTHDVLIDVYKEKHVIGKGLRNENSKEIFEIMVENRSVEFGVYFQPYGFSATINTQTDALFGPGDGFASGAQQHMKKFTAMASRLAGVVEDLLESLGLPY